MLCLRLKFCLNLKSPLENLEIENSYFEYCGLTNIGIMNLAE